VGLLHWNAVAIALTLIVGCGAFSTPKKVWTRNFDSYPLPVWTTDGMYLVSGRAGALFLTASPLDLSRYRGVVIEEIQISTKPRSRALKPAEEERLKGYFTRRLMVAFERNGCPVVDASGEDVLHARLAVLDLELRRGRQSHAGMQVAGVSTDEITIVLELRDALEDNRRLLYGDKRRLPFGVYAGSDSIPIRRVEDAFYYFSIDVQQRLGQVQRGEFPAPPPPPTPLTPRSAILESRRLLQPEV
jgi:hypothetical protein